MPRAPTRLSRVILPTAAAIAVALVVTAAPSSAGPYYLKIETIEGESRAGDANHDKWIHLESVTWGKSPAQSGGVRVATGDVNNDAKPARKKGGNVEYGWKVEKGEKSAPGGTGAPGSVSAGTPDPQAIGLLVPAVQKVRASMRGSYPDCKVGQRHDMVSATGADGKRYVLSGVEITACSVDQVSLNFEQIKAK